jgi:hypothetical protein
VPRRWPRGAISPVHLHGHPISRRHRECSA